jgi:hypothetical protein
MDDALRLARMLLPDTRYLRGQVRVELDLDDPDDQRYMRDSLVDVIGQHLRAQRTGGADWSAAYVWAIDPRIAKDWYAVEDELFLVWSEGDLYEPLQLYARTVAADDSYDLQELDTELSANDIARLLKAHSDLARRTHPRLSPRGRPAPRRRTAERDLHDMTYQEIRALVFPPGEHPGQLVGLRDRLTDAEIASLPRHPAWDDFPESFRSWVYEALKEF